jgi:hypothetical protein
LDGFRRSFQCILSFVLKCEPFSIWSVDIWILVVEFISLTTVCMCVIERIP